MPTLVTVRAVVIDDDAEVCRQLGGWLRDAAIDVITFTDPHAGLEHLRRAPCRLAVVDLRMPNADGAAVVREVCQAVPDIRVLALSAFPETREVLAAFRAGACDLLEKPVQRPALLAAVEAQLAAGGLVARTEEEFGERLGAALRAARQARDRTLAEVADACGLTAAQLSQIELGRSGTSAWTLARIAAALAVPLDQLLRRI